MHVQLRCALVKGLASSLLVNERVMWCVNVEATEMMSYFYALFQEKVFQSSESEIPQKP